MSTRCCLHQPRNARCCCILDDGPRPVEACRMMDFVTYWLVVPITGLVLMIPAWAWLLWSLRHKRKSPAE